ncbi:MAG: UvrD-helicase domain-containing protein [Planctomycetes bacterium]|nr:UvrD-helicase domain-containing protein [Planctomycetota bacterium]
MSDSRRPEQLLEHLTEPQREAVTHATGPLLVVAGPGSGKTRVITHRAAYLACTVTQPQHILAITFTNKAANEMAERMRRLGVAGATCSTFHSFCARLLRMYGDRVGLGPDFSIYDEADQTAAIKQAIERLDLDAEAFTPSKMLNAISKAKNDMIDATQYTEQARDWNEKVIAPVYTAYEQILAEQNAADFDDLLIKAARLLGDHADLRDRLEDRYRYVLVDEYQDTNHAQYLIARGLCLQRENLCVTGDPDQSIYGWRGANIHNILQFEEDFPSAKVVRLEQNYRSTPQILAAADAVIRHNRKRKRKELWTGNAAGRPVRVAGCDDAQSEAAFVAGQIGEHVAAGGAYGQVAVFYRVNALSRNIEAALRDASIPYQVARGVAFFQRKEIRDTLAYLRLVANPLDQVALRRIINVPARGLGEVTVERVISHAAAVGRPVLEVLGQPESIAGVGPRAAGSLREFTRMLTDIAAAVRQGSLQTALEQTVRQTGLAQMWSRDEDDDAIANADELINFAAEYDRQHADGSGSLTDWLQQISLVADQDAIDPELGAVTLMTLHAAKGLEFDVVFIVGVEDGLLPHERARDRKAEVEEERRLFFVGMTRARRNLTISSADWRDRRGMSQRTSRSLFLAELPRDKIALLRIGEDGQPNGDETADEETPASSDEFAEWRQGQLVRHPKYGVGRLLWVQPRGGRTHAGVKFAAHGQKTLVLEFAKLQAVDSDDAD